MWWMFDDENKQLKRDAKINKQKLMDKYYSANYIVENDDVYYGLLESNGKTFEDSKNVIVDKDYKVIINKILEYFGPYRLILKNLVFYRIKYTNPYVLSLDILKRLPSSICEYTYIFEDYKIKSNFTLSINDKDVLPLWIEKYKNYIFKKYRLDILIFNDIQKTRLKTISRSIKKYLKTKTFKQLSQIIHKYNIQIDSFKCFMNKKTKIKMIVSHLLHNY